MFVVLGSLRYSLAAIFYFYLSMEDQSPGMLLGANWLACLAGRVGNNGGLALFFCKKTHWKASCLHQLFYFGLGFASNSWSLVKIFHSKGHLRSPAKGVQRWEKNNASNCTNRLSTSNNWKNKDPKFLTPPFFWPVKQCFFWATHLNYQPDQNELFSAPDGFYILILLANKNLGPNRWSLYVTIDLRFHLPSGYLTVRHGKSPCYS